MDAVRDSLSRIDPDAVGMRIGADICAFVPGMKEHADPEVRDEMALTSTSNVVAVVAGLLDGRPAADVPMPGHNRRWVEDLVQRNLDVSTVPWACNFGQSGLADALREVVLRADVPDADKLALAHKLSQYATGYVTSVCAQMVDHFETEFATWNGCASAVRREVLDALLDGRLTDAASAGETLGYALAGRHVATIVWADLREVSAPGPEVLAGAARELLRRLGATDVLAIEAGSATAWAWGRGPEVRDAVEPDVHVGAGLLAAVGAAGEDLDGFVRSHHDAVQARRMAGLLSRRPGAVVGYRNVALTSLIAADPGQAARFIDDELGPLGADTDAMRRLRATLAVFFDEAMRPVRTARRLGVHQNTVIYRVHQIEQLLARPLAERRLELETALRLADARDALVASSGA